MRVGVHNGAWIVQYTQISTIAAPLVPSPFGAAQPKAGKGAFDVAVFLDAIYGIWSFYRFGLLRPARFRMNV